MNWVASFLKSRQQFVEIRDYDNYIQSRVVVVSNGFPQGSVLGPLLLSIYM